MAKLQAAALALAVIFAFGCAAAQNTASPGASADVTAGRVADIAAFRAQFLAVDKSYTPAARAEAEARLTRLEHDAATISPIYFELELARIVALADNGHTLDFPFVRSGHTNRVPVRFGVFGQDFYVLRATAENADLLGARLTAIDGNAIAQVRDVARTLAGGLPGRRDTFASGFLESPEQLAALHLATHTDDAAYSFALRNGQTITRRMNGEAPGPTRLAIGGPRIFFPQPLANESATWRTALAADAAPWAFREPDASFRWRAAPELDALVIDFRSNSDMPDRTVADFLAEVQREITTRHPRNLVIDQRLDYPGGDLQTTRAFMQALPGEVQGRIFVLTSQWTFSAAIASTGYLKQAAPDRVSIVGDAVGDRLNFFAEGRSIVLPHSQARINYATMRDNYLNGCEGFSDCYPYIVQYAIALPTLAPDIPAPWTIEAYLAGRDPGMEAIARALGTFH